MKSKLTVGLLCLIFVLLVTNCKDDNEEGFKKLALPLKESFDHFDFYYDDELNKTQVGPIREALERNYSMLIKSYSISDLPKIKIALWSSLDAFNDTMNNQNPGALGYVNGKDEIRMYYTGDPYLPSAAIHEFTHIITLFVDPDFASNPRWLWEAIAQYESHSFVHPKMLSYMVDGNYPTMDVLSNEQGDGQRIYQLGFVIGEFIVETWGYDGMLSLIKSHGDVTKTFDTTEAEFELQWYTFVSEKYL